MSNPTTPFGWQMPTNTDLVTDLPADFEVFGQAVATSMADLLGGTSGQVLSKNSNTDMDFAWVDPNPGDITGVTAGTGLTGGGTSGTVSLAIDSTVATLTGTQTLTNKTLTSPALTTPTISTATTNGDLLYGTGSGALTRLGIGSTNQVLTVAGGVPTWATPSGGSGGPTFDAYSTPSQNISASTLTKVTLQNETWDTAGNFASSRFTPTTAGYYQFNAQISFEGSANSTYRLYYYKNGSSYSAYSVGVSVANPTVAYSWTIPMNGSSDYVELYGWTDAGVGPGGARAFYYAQMQGTWIRSL